MVTFHPAYILRQTGGEIEGVKRLVWSDLKAVRTKLDEPLFAPPESATNEIAQGSFFDAG